MSAGAVTTAILGSSEEPRHTASPAIDKPGMTSYASRDGIILILSHLGGLNVL